MATPEALVKEGRLIKFEAVIDIGEQPVRQVFMTNEAWEWYCVIKEQGNENMGFMPYRHVKDLLSDFVAGGHLSQDEELKRLTPKDKDIWEFRITQSKPQVRIFGWFYDRSCFIVSHFAYRNNIKGNKRFLDEIKKVIQTRKNINCQNMEWNKNEKHYTNL